MTSRFNQQYFDLLFAITWKEVTVRYKQAVFGFLWIILNPMLQMIIMGSVLSYFVKIDNYFLFLFTGLLPWQFFSTSLNKVTPSFVYERALIQKSPFPRDVIPLSLILSSFINFIFSEGLFLIFINLFINNLNLNSYLLIIIASLWLLVFTIGISLLTSSLNVRFRDVAFFVQTLITLWFYGSPILYSLNLIPSQISYLLQFNPIAVPFSFFHSAILNHPLPSLNLIMMNLLLSMAILVLGIKTFNKESPYFVDWL